MNKKHIAGAFLAAVLLIGGILAFNLLRDDASSRDRDDASASETTPTPSPSAGASASAPVPGAVAFPTPSLAGGSDDAETVMAINQIIFEVTQEAINRPKEDRMTSEEISALIETRIKELRERK